MESYQAKEANRASELSGFQDRLARRTFLSVFSSRVGERSISSVSTTENSVSATQAVLHQSRRDNVSWRVALIFVALTATAVIAPFRFLGNPSGHDIQFHFSSWMEAARQWRQGIFYPRWAEWANWGFGEPRFIFYPPLSWMLGAAFGSLLPWKMVPGAMIWTSLVIAGMSMWTLAREWLPGRESIAAAAFFAAGPYHIVMSYYRSDFAELLGAAFFPLLFWGAARIAQGSVNALPPLAVAFAAVWLCNAPAGVIATYLLILALLVACVAMRKIQPLLCGGGAMAAGFALAGFYIVPAAYERQWVRISDALVVSLQPIHNFLFARDNELGFLQFNMRVTRVAMGMMIVTLAAGICAARRRHSLGPLWWMLCAVAALATFLMFRPSLFLFRLLPELSFIQFPWRWMDALAVPLAFSVAAASGAFRRRWTFWLIVGCAAAGIVATATTVGRDTWWDGKDAAYLQRGIQAGHGYDGMDEYAPLGVSHWDLPGEPADIDDKDAPPPKETPRVEGVDAETGDLVPLKNVSVRYEAWAPELKNFTVSSNAPASFAVRLLNYPAWEVKIEGAREQPGYVPVTGQMVLPVAAGTHRIEIRFRRTWDRLVGAILSLLAAATLLAFRWRTV